MKTLLTLVIRWILRHFVSFLVIVSILTVADFFQEQIKEFVSISTALSTFKNGQENLGRYISKTKEEQIERVARFGKETDDNLKARINEIDVTIKQKKSGQRSPFDRKLSFLTGQGVVDDLKGDLEINLLEQERDYLAQLQSLAQAKKVLKEKKDELERLRQIHVNVYRELGVNEIAQGNLKANNPILVYIPFTYEHQNLIGLESAHDEIFKRNQSASDNYQRQRKILDSFEKLKTLPQFEIRHDQIVRMLQPLNDRIAELENNYRQNWLAKCSELVIHVIPTALGILLSIILAPIAIKATFYFVIAPLASSRPAIYLLPKISGAIDGESENTAGGTGGTRISTVSKSIEVDGTHELLVHPEYLQSSSHQGKKDTKWLLDYAYPMSSLASGMFALTRIRTTSPETFVVSDTKDPYSEIGVISIPEGSAIVFQPHSLIGVVQRNDHPIRISRQWHLGSLNAWLTLQLRFLIFHGPAKLIVKGCRGIRVEQAGKGRSINQAATIGFSANLAYSNTRCETFASYLMGKQELFNDKFAGENGFYFYEETPHFGKKTGITGRGIEGVTDSILKIFGI